jgi:hypothetical protein
MTTSGSTACPATPLPFRLFVKDIAISPQVDGAFAWAARGSDPTD